MLAPAPYRNFYTRLHGRIAFSADRPTSRHPLALSHADPQSGTEAEISSNQKAIVRSRRGSGTRNPCGDALASTLNEVKEHEGREIKGGAKKKLGRVTNDPNLEAEGDDEKKGGKMQKKIGAIERIRHSCRLLHGRDPC